VCCSCHLIIALVDNGLNIVSSMLMVVISGVVLGCVRSHYATDTMGWMRQSANSLGFPLVVTLGLVMHDGDDHCCAR